MASIYRLVSGLLSEAESGQALGELEVATCKPRKRASTSLEGLKARWVKWARYAYSLAYAEAETMRHAAHWTGSHSLSKMVGKAGRGSLARLGTAVTAVPVVGA